MPQDVGLQPASGHSPLILCTRSPDTPPTRGRGYGVGEQGHIMGVLHAPPKHMGVLHAPQKHMARRPHTRHPPSRIGRIPQCSRHPPFSHLPPPPPAPPARSPPGRGGGGTSESDVRACNAGLRREVRRSGTFESWSCRCYFHTKGPKCNKTLSWGSTMSPDEAKHRIMEWCVRGLSVPDEEGARVTHMADEPSLYLASELRPVPELTRLALTG
jgi:hypothetical protein